MTPLALGRLSVAESSRAGFHLRANLLPHPVPGKKRVTIYDYLDEQLALTASMYRKRLPAYRQMGYTIHGEEDK